MDKDRIREEGLGLGQERFRLDIRGKKNFPGKLVKPWKGPSRTSLFSADSAWD